MALRVPLITIMNIIGGNPQPPVITMSVDQDGNYVGPSAGGSTGGGPNPAQDGTDATGVTAPTGAVGIRCWLSGIFAGIGTSGDAVGAVTVAGQLRSLVNTFKTVIAVTINGALPAGPNKIGDVGTP